MKVSVIVLAVASVCGLASVDAHSWLKQPTSRETYSSPDVTNTMACPVMTAGTTTSVQPGQTLTVRYPRNNHIGGFIRWSIVPLGEESKDAFDKNVFHYSCRESGSTCVPQGTNSVYSGDGGAAENSILCGDTIPLPNYLKAGNYVLQWTWMSVGGSYGYYGWANEQYRSCADLKFTVAGTGSKPSCPSFTGGDRVTKLEGKSSDQCFYFRDNDLVTSVFKGEESNYQQYYKYGKPAQIEKCSGGSSSTTTSDSGNATVKPAGNSASGSSPTVAPSSGSSSTKKPKKTKSTSTSSTSTSKGTKTDWQYCSTNSECANSCCSKKYSDDNQLKCTPNGC